MMGKRKHAVLYLLLFVPAMIFAGGAKESAGETGENRNERVVAWVSIPPQKYFVRQVGGDMVDVSVVIPPGAEPHTYEPTARQMQALGRADIYFRIGIDFEDGFIPTLQQNLPHLRIVDTREGLEMIPMEGHGDDDDEDHDDDGDEHGHEDDHAEEAGRPDPHVWLSPELVKQQAATIRDALADLRPEHRETFESNYRTFAADIDRLDEEIRTTLQPVEGGTFYIFHPNFGYFAHEYGLEQEAIETGGNEPSPQQLSRLIARAKEEGAKVIFVQPEFSQDASKRLAAAIGGTVVGLDTLSEEWPSVMREAAVRIREGLVR